MTPMRTTLTTPRSVRAIYEDGILRPLDPLSGIAEHSEVRVIIRAPAQSIPSLAECVGILAEEDTEEMIRAVAQELEQVDVEGADHLAAEHTSASASFLRLVACLSDLRQLRPGWNTYDAEPPSTVALTTALWVLRSLHLVGFLPDKILPLADGGVALVFNRGSLYANVECFNDGEVAAGISNRSDYHDAWGVDLGAVEDSIHRINAFLNA